MSVTPKRVKYISKIPNERPNFELKLEKRPKKALKMYKYMSQIPNKSLNLNEKSNFRKKAARNCLQ